MESGAASRDGSMRNSDGRRIDGSSWSKPTCASQPNGQLWKLMVVLTGAGGVLALGAAALSHGLSTGTISLPT